MVALTPDEPITRADLFEVANALQSLGLGVLVLLAALLAVAVVRMVGSW